MKKTMICAICATALFFNSCKDKKEIASDNGIEMSDSSHKGSFTVDGATYKGNVTTQYFGSNKETDNFSVLCQQDEPFALLQVTFANEKDAVSSNLQPKGGSYKVNPGEYGLSLSISESDKEFIANEKSGGSLKVEGNKLTITDMKLFDADGKEKTVNETVEF